MSEKDKSGTIKRDKEVNLNASTNPKALRNSAIEEENDSETPINFDDYEDVFEYYAKSRSGEERALVTFPDRDVEVITEERKIRTITSTVPVRDIRIQDLFFYLLLLYFS